MPSSAYSKKWAANGLPLAEVTLDMKRLVLWVFDTTGEISEFQKFMGEFLLQGFRGCLHDKEKQDGCHVVYFLHPGFIGDVPLLCSYLKVGCATAVHFPADAGQFFWDSKYV